MPDRSNAPILVMLPTLVLKPLFPALLLSNTPFLGCRCRCRPTTLDEDGVLIASSFACGSEFGGCGRRRLVQLLHELGLNACSALLPPFFLGSGLRLYLFESFPEDGIGSDLICGLENGLTPVGRKSICLRHVRIELELVYFLSPTSITTSRSSSSISFSARKNRCQRSSPTLPRCNKVLHACFAALI